MSALRLAPRSLHGRLVALLLLLLLVLGGTSLAVIVKGSRLLSDEVRFRLDRDVARHVAETVEPFANGQVAEARLKDLFMHTMVINPTLEVYLLDLDGKVLAYDAPDEKVVRHRVDLAPIESFVADGGAHTVRGDDPRSVDGRKPISVHPVESEGRPMGYLYIILGGEDYESTFAALQQSYILRYAALFLVGSFLVAGIVGVFSVGRLTRPLRRLHGRIATFQPALEGPSPTPEREDELRALERAYEAMSRRIEEQMEELHATDERRREFVASISHDLRTPTSAVQGYLETLIDRSERLAPGDREHLIAMALRQTRRLAKLVGQLFELARLEAQEDVPNKESFALAELVQDIVCEFQLRAEQKGVALRARFPYDLPPVHADIGLIARALDNLLDNALRYTPPHSEVVVTIGQVEGGLEVRVTDSGPGIPADAVPRLFDRFYRAPHQGGSDEGAGLGLAITRRIIVLHDGEISVHSEPHQATTFSFVLPTAGEPR